MNLKIGEMQETIYLSRLTIEITLLHEQYTEKNKLNNVAISY